MTDEQLRVRWRRAGRTLSGATVKTHITRIAGGRYNDKVIEDDAAINGSLPSGSLRGEIGSADAHYGLGRDELAR